MDYLYPNADEEIVFLRNSDGNLSFPKDGAALLALCPDMSWTLILE